MNTVILKSRCFLVAFSLFLAATFLIGCTMGTKYSKSARPVGQPTADSRPKYPTFPWPPPRASTRCAIPGEFLETGRGTTRMSDVSRKIERALQESGYSELSYYAVPGGFAVATRMEQFNPDGSSKSGLARWIVKPRGLQKFTLASYLTALVRGVPGRYRVFVFVVSPHPLRPAKTSVTTTEAQAWYGEGLDRLPVDIGKLGFSARRGYACAALVYEFERKRESEDASVVLGDAMPGRTQLIRAGIWRRLRR